MTVIFDDPKAGYIHKRTRDTPDAKYAQKYAHSHPRFRVFTVPKSTYRPHRWAASVHFIAKDRHKATELGLTWHASFIGTSIEIYLAPGWSGQGV